MSYDSLKVLWIWLDISLYIYALKISSLRVAFKNLHYKQTDESVLKGYKSINSISLDDVAPPPLILQVSLRHCCFLVTDQQARSEPCANA
jgi:hypothetical protein